MNLLCIDQKKVVLLNFEMNETCEFSKKKNITVAKGNKVVKKVSNVKFFNSHL